MKRKKFTAIIKQIDQWWIGWVMELPGVICQEKTLEELKERLREGISLVEEWDEQHKFAEAKWSDKQAFVSDGENYQTEILTA